MKFLRSFLLSVSLLSFLLLFVPGINAETIDTIITGMVSDSSGNPVAGASVSVVCDGNVRNTTTNGSGDYLVTYPSSECVQGDTATASASTSEGDASNSGVVQRFTAGPGLELDIAIINISVPEFGLISGAVTALSSAAAFLGLKRKFGI